jgi:hypothetical protein
MRYQELLDRVVRQPQSKCTKFCTQTSNYCKSHKRGTPPAAGPHLPRSSRQGRTQLVGAQHLSLADHEAILLDEMQQKEAIDFAEENDDILEASGVGEE